MRNRVFILMGLAASVLPVAAVNILTSTDTIRGGLLSGTTFTVGNPGTVGGANNWPAAEPPEDLINTFKGGANEKYLNFARLNTGVIITPSFGASIITSMTLSAANDAVERDPADYFLYGTNVPLNLSLSGPGSTFNLSDFTPIDTDTLSLPDERDITFDTFAIGTAGGSTEITVPIGGTTAYTSYMLIFPNVKGPAGNSMQISELQFDGRPIPEPAGAGLMAAAFGLALRRRRP
jgi:hypothetical protein